jgi:hypothetical protein
MVDGLAREVWDRMKRRMLDLVDGGRQGWTYPDDVFEAILAGEPTREVVEWAVRETLELMEDNSMRSEQASESADGHGACATPENLRRYHPGRFSQPSLLPGGEGESQRAMRDAHRNMRAES